MSKRSFIVITLADTPVLIQSSRTLHIHLLSAGPTLPDAPSALDQSTRQDIGQDASPGIWPLTTGTACTEDLGPASKVDGQDADKSPASMQNSQNSAEQAAISTPGMPMPGSVQLIYTNGDGQC